MKRAEADAAIERVLRSRRHPEGRHDSEAGAAAGCPGPDDVAAYAEGGLDADERARFEAHAASCERCLVVLGALVLALEPAAAEAAAGSAVAGARVGSEGPAAWWRNWRVRWVVPVAAAATAVAIYVAVDRDTAILPVPSSPSEVSAPSLDATAEYRVPPAATEPLAEVPRERSQRELPTGSPPPAAAPRSKAPLEVAAKREAEFAGAAPPAAPASPPLSLEAGRSEVEGAPPPEAAQLVQERDARNEIEPVRAGLAAPVRDEARVPGGRRAWRVGVGGAIERSDDAGATWTAQASGVGTDLLAVAAPTPDTVWAVGRRGVVLHARDGVTWRRVPFPDAVDLVAVEAATARITVTAADGRRWTTTDGGASWAPVP